MIISGIPVEVVKHRFVNAAPDHGQSMALGWRNTPRSIPKVFCALFYKKALLTF
jgi:hypothetical protein